MRMRNQILHNKPPAAEHVHRQFFVKARRASFEALRDGRKRFDVLPTAMDAHVGDEILFLEWTPDRAPPQYSGRLAGPYRVSYVEHICGGRIVGVAFTPIEFDAEALPPSHSWVSWLKGDPQ